MSINENPVTEICIVADKSRCPPGYGVIAKAYDDTSSEADVWKDGLFAFSRVYRYICVCKSPPQNSFVCNVVADLALVNDKDIVPAGYVAIEYTTDTREKALRKKLLCVRTVPRETTVDAVSDLIILAKQKRPPQGFTLAGEIDGLLLCYKYGVIPPDFPGNRSNANVYPNLPYPIHPLSHTSNGPASTPTRPAPPLPIQNHMQGSANRNSWNENPYARQTSISGAPAHSGIDGVPFELNPRIKISQSNNNNRLPVLRPINSSEFDYTFSIENSILIDGWN